MKKILLILILVFIAAPVYAFTSAIQGVVAGSYSSGCSNVPATDRIGLATDAGTNDFTPTAEYIFCTPFTPTMTCSTGTLDTAYIDKRYNTGEVNAKVCLYERTGNGSTAPEDGDDVVYCTSAITDSGAAGVKSVAVSGTVNISSSGTYWVCVASDSTRWEMSATASHDNQFYCSTVSGGSYTSMPSDLYDCAHWQESSWGDLEAWFTIK